MKWYVVYTKPKWEKKIAEKLNQLGIIAYCPVIQKIEQWSDRKKKVSKPLFNSYIFVQIEEKERNTVFLVPGTIRYLFWLGKPAIVRDEEIENIKVWLESPNLYDVKVEPYKLGDKITLKTGVFASQTAIIKEVTQNYYTLILESLGCVLKIERKGY